MIGRFIRNFLNGQHIIHKIRQVQTVRLTFLHQCIKNECPPVAVFSFGACMASSSSNRPSHRSKLLNDYHNNRAANLQLTDLGKHIVEFALDPQGSSFIKQKLEHANPTETAHLVDSLRGHVLTLALHKSGSHVIRAALKSVDKASQIEIINELSAQVLLLSLHEYGSWVIRSLLEHCTEQQRRHVLEQLHGNVLSLVMDKYGNYVIQRVLEHGLPEDREPIMHSLQENLFTLVTDKYGSIMIQHVIEHGLPEDRERIVRSLQGDIMKNAHHLSISSIIEKCLIFGTTEQKNALIDQVCMDNGSGSPPLLKMMKYPIGNDVVQKILNVADSARRQKLMLAIKTAPIKNTANRSPKSLTHPVQAQQRGGAE